MIIELDSLFVWELYYLAHALLSMRHARYSSHTSSCPATFSSGLGLLRPFDFSILVTSVGYSTIVLLQVLTTVKCALTDLS